MTLHEILSKARPGAFDDQDILEMVSVLELLRPGDRYLEIGVDQGKSLSVARLVTNPEVEIYGIDIASDPQVDGAIFIQGDSKEIAKTFNKQINVLFIDGDHSYEGCKADFDGFFPRMPEHGAIFFHDFNKSNRGVIKVVADFLLSHDFVNFKVTSQPNGMNTMAKIIF